MKKLLSLFILTLSFNALADCYMKMLNDYNLDSRHFKIYIDNVSSNESEIMDEQTAINTAHYITDQVCQEKFQVTKTSCERVFPNIPVICYVELDQLPGYFIITKDYVDHVNAIFNRWD